MSLPVGGEGPAESAATCRTFLPENQAIRPPKIDLCPPIKAAPCGAISSHEHASSLEKHDDR